MTQQIKNFDELKLLYFDLKNSKIYSSIQIEQNVDTLKLNRLRQIEYNQQFIKIKHDSISTGNDLIKMILSFIIALPLVKILNKSKNQLKRSVSGSSDVNYKDK
ncbi:MAG: hypothetical protein RQ735_00755 [Flavobacteriaceae bacterium]|nr:hypothetical protein [Flavobacteriaceae bacterium]